MQEKFLQKQYDEAQGQLKDIVSHSSRMMHARKLY